jgi:hypothetical protein
MKKLIILHGEVKEFIIHKMIKNNFINHKVKQIIKVKNPDIFIFKEI